MRQGMLWSIRTGVLAVVLLFTIVVLGLSAGYIAKLDSIEDELIVVTVPAFVGLSLAIAIITLFAIGPMVAFDFLRRGAVTSWILVELIVTGECLTSCKGHFGADNSIGVFMILWLATAAIAASATSGQTVDCRIADAFNSDDGMLCRTYQAIEAFSFINWILLLVYFITLLVLALVAHSRGSTGVWRETVRERDFLSKSGKTGAPMMQTV
ncbi:hypothetical protein DFH11DRAFT_331604 [Phellopilus nigrolimitatus]|nr:hypothetical protein DFH11DRAFT_331604 [Phellopilus nigrolimitatus]